LTNENLHKLGISGAADSVTLTAQVGLLYHVRPEMCDEARNYTAAVNISSFALIVYEVLVGQSPFSLTFAPTALMKKVIIGADIQTIVNRGWSVDPTKRPSFDNISLVPGSIGFKLSPGVDSGRVRDFMSLVGCGSRSIWPMFSAKEDHQMHQSGPSSTQCRGSYVSLFWLTGSFRSIDESFDMYWRGGRRLR
jgi:hypothetical protein